LAPLMQHRHELLHPPVQQIPPGSQDRHFSALKVIIVLSSIID
jgi:hypothetical protein